MQKPRKSARATAPDQTNDDIIANVLRRLSLVDSPPERGFNRFTRLVCELANVRMAMVTFVEERADRQFFKASVGLPAGVTQTPLNVSFCKLVTRSGEMVEISDARSDVRVSGNPLIEKMGVVAYLGAPINGPSGEMLGSLCAVDKMPRDWTDNEKRAMTDLAACVTDHIALRNARMN